MSKTKNIAVYCRVSTLDQKKKETIARQLQANTEQLKVFLGKTDAKYQLFPRSPLSGEKDLRKVYFCDEGYNLEDLEAETAISELIDLIKEGKVHAVLVDTEDRLLRSKKRQVRALIQDLFEEYEIQLFTHKGETPHGMLLDITSAIAANDKREIGRKLTQGKIEKMKREGGPLNNRLPFGYRWNKKTLKFEIVEEEANIIRWAVAASSGKATPDMPELIRLAIDEHPDGVPDPVVLNALMTLGYRMRSFYQRTNLMDQMEKNPSGAFNDKFIFCLLREEKYCGKRSVFITPPNLVGKGRVLTNDKKEKIEIEYPPIISKSDWEYAIKIRRNRAFYYGKNTSHDYLLQGLVVCAECGVRMQSASSYSRRWVRHENTEKKYYSFSYKCNNRKKSAPHPCKIKNNHKAADLDAAVWAIVSDYILNPSLVLKNEMVVREDLKINNTIEKTEKDLNAIVQKFTDFEEQEGRMLEKLARGVLDENQFKLFSKRTATERLSLMKSKKRLETEIERNRKKLREINRINLTEIIEQYTNRLGKLSFQERRSITQKVVRQVVLSGDGCDYIDFYPPS